MTMSKSDFELIARVLSESKEDCKGDPDREGYRNVIAGRFANVLSETNPRFDRVRFLRACRVREDA